MYIYINSYLHLGRPFLFYTYKFSIEKKRCTIYNLTIKLMKVLVFCLVLHIFVPSLIIIYMYVFVEIVLKLTLLWQTLLYTWIHTVKKVHSRPCHSPQLLFSNLYMCTHTFMHVRMMLTRSHYFVVCSAHSRQFVH